MIKKITNFVIPFVITTIILLVYFYLVHGLPVAQELEKNEYRICANYAGKQNH